MNDPMRTAPDDADRFGVPPSAVVDARPVRAGEAILPPPEPTDEDLELDELDAADLDRLTRGDEQQWWNPLSWLRGPGVTAVLVVLGAALALFVASQAVGVIADVQSLPEPWRWGVYGLVGLCLGVIVLAAGRATVSFLRFRATPRLSSRALTELAERAELREEARADLDTAAAHLHRILADYPAGDDPGRRSLTSLGFTADAARALAADRRTLLDEYGQVPSAQWVARYRELFAARLDDAARRVVRKRSLLVGAKTAAVPNGPLDTAILLTHAFLMVGDLCRLYRVRTDRRGTMAITWRILIAAFVAGRLEDLTDEAARHLSDAAAGSATGVLAKAGSAVAGKVVGKAAEGVVNAAFTYRLGRAAMRQLRPID
jgi:uncharacterized membrane protein YcjF (UPF0283 family)